MTTAIVVAEAQPIVLKELSADYTEQLGTTMLAILDTIEQTRRKARQTYLDIKEFYEGSEKIQKMLTEALWDKSEMKEGHAIDRVELQELYFSMTVMIFSLTLGTLVGNLWTELDWLPQLGIFHALVGIGALLSRIWHKLNQCPSDPKERVHRSRLYIALLALGFCLGRLCSYLLPVIAPRLLAPFVIAFLIDNKLKLTRGGRVEFFIAFAVLMIVGSWLLLFVCRQTSYFNILLLFIVIAVKIGFFYGHFQIIYYIHCAHTDELRKQKEASTKEDKAKTPPDQPPKGGCCSGDGSAAPEEEKNIGFDQWKCISHFSYILASVVVDTLMAFFLG
uniref:Uncharacterized protein n=2 Tax=Meloidogyne enterolobii TaxID=390850 RepID=A0A6V7TL05_MELEN|nr:unnamed protein product [Meloidogyne enterolobii]